MAKKEANLRNFIGRSVGKASLAEDKERESTPNVRQDGDFANTPFTGGTSFEREEPPKDRMRRYWRQYETTPLVRKPINSFAQQVVEPGYRVVVESDSPKSERVKPNPETGLPDPAPGEADDGSGVLKPEERKKLEEWLEKSAIIEKEPDKDIRHMLKKAIVQREVRGTCLIEKVYAVEDEEKLYGLAFLNAETVRPNTRPGQPLLLLPDDKPGDFEDVGGELPKTDDGLTAAYTQYTTSSGYGSQSPNSDDVNNFALNDVIKLTRDSDVNEAWGTSRLEAVSSEIQGLKNKMRDQNEAIASKAYPLWLFLFGTEDQPWDSDDINQFMRSHEMDEFHPGLKQGVRGDVDIETISGEVADIIDYLEFDVDYITSAMPMPKYALGAFEQKLNASGSKTQERMTQRQIKEARRELETELSSVVQEKAMQMFNLNKEDAEKVKFKLGIPGEEYHRQNANDNNINYNGVKNNQPGSPKQVPSETPSSDSEDDADSAPAESPQDGPSSDEEENSVWDVQVEELDESVSCGRDGDCDAEELVDPRVVGTSDIENDLAGIIESTMLEFRDSTLGRIRGEYADAPNAATQAFEGLANTRLNAVLRDRDLSDSGEVLMRETIQRTLDTLSQDNQKVTLDTNFGNDHRQNAARYGGVASRETRDALEELSSRMEQQFRRGAEAGDTLENIVNRVENTYSDEKLAQRAQLIARMQIQSAIENTKLTEFERSDDVAGVRIVNPCNENTTRLCENLAGCGARDGAVAELGGEPLGEQWADEVGDRLLFQGFDPLPPVPPFHFNCRSGMIPLPAEELEDAQEDDVTTADELAEKYGIDMEEGE